MNKILIPVDSSDYSKRAVEEGIIMAEAFGCQIILLYVASISVNFTRFYEINLPQDALAEIMEEEKKNAEVMLNSFKESFGKMSGKVITVILEGNTVDEIIDYSKKFNVDMIIVGSHGVGSILRKNILGSVASKVLHYSDKPVLIIK